MIGHLSKDLGIVPKHFGRSGRTVRVLVLMLFLLPGLGLAETRATSSGVEEGLTCQCGCGLTVHSCNHLTCGSAIPLRQEVRGFVDEGLTRDEILFRFQEKYGEKILSAPTAKGFNLTAWVLPFLLLGGASIALLMVIRRWTLSNATESAPPPPLSDEDRERIEHELRKHGH